MTIFQVFGSRFVHWTQLEAGAHLSDTYNWQLRLWRQEKYSGTELTPCPLSKPIILRTVHIVGLIHRIAMYSKRGTCQNVYLGPNLTNSPQAVGEFKLKSVSIY